MKENVYLFVTCRARIVPTFTFTSFLVIAAGILCKDVDILPASPYLSTGKGFRGFFSLFFAFVANNVSIYTNAANNTRTFYVNYKTPGMRFFDTLSL